MDKHHDKTPKAKDKFQTVGEQLHQRWNEVDSKRFVLDWFQKQLTEITYAYQGVSHSLNKLAADLAKERQEFVREIDSLKETCERLAIERDEANAAIGELQERVDRMADFLNKQKGKTKC